MGTGEWQGLWGALGGEMNITDEKKSDWAQKFQINYAK